MKKIFAGLFVQIVQTCQRAFAEANHPLSRGRFLEACNDSTPFEEGASVSKNSKRVPPALKHGIYSGLGLLPTESPAKFRKFRKQIFAELNLVGRLEEDAGDEIVRLEWRRKNLSTYTVASRVRARHSSIYAEQVPRVRYPFELELPPHPDNPAPEELEAARKGANKRARAELGAALELLEIGDMATLEKELAIMDRLNGMIDRAYKKLAYVRAIKSMAPPSLPPPAPALLENAA